MEQADMLPDEAAATLQNKSHNTGFENIDSLLLFKLPLILLMSSFYWLLACMTSQRVLYKVFLLQIK